MYTKHTYLTRKQIELQKITEAVIFDKDWVKPAMIFEEQEENYKTSYQYEFDSPKIIEEKLGINEHHTP